MRLFIVPKGKAGGDVLAAIEESVQAHLDQMFEQDAKHSAIEHGVGRTGAGHESGERKARVPAQLRECEAHMNFHAGRALDLAMQLVYGKGTDRVLGREYPGGRPEGDRGGPEDARSQATVRPDRCPGWSRCRRRVRGHVSAGSTQGSLGRHPGR